MSRREVSSTDVVTVRRAHAGDIAGAAGSFAESFTASVWARLGGRSAEAYLAHFVHDPREFMIVAEHAEHGIVGGCLGTMRMEHHRRGVLLGSLPRIGAALVRDVAREPGKGVELGRRLVAGLLGAADRLRGPSEAPAAVEHVDTTWPRSTAEPGYIAAYWVSPRARGHQVAARMSQEAVEVFRKQAFLWCEVHTYEDNVASQTTALRADFRLVRREGTHLAYRRWIGEGEPGDVEVEVHEDPSAVHDLAETWTRLLAITPDGSGFHAWPWIAAHLAEIAEPRIGIVRFRSAPVAVLPLQLQSGRRLCFVAERRSNYGGPVADPEHMSAVVAGFREVVARCEPSTVDLHGLRERSPFRAAIEELVLGRLGAPRSVETITCPEVSLEGGWDAVWGRHKSKHRGNWKRAEKRLERLGTLTFEERTDAAGILAALPSAVRLYEERWGGRNVDKAFGAQAMEFQSRAADALARDGSAVMCILELDGEIIAFSYSLRANAVCSSYTLAHDDRYAPYSPGQLLLIRVLERAARRSDPMFDFSVGEETYKDVWATGRQRLFRMVWGAGALRRTTIDQVRAELRARTALRRLKQEGVRSLLPASAWRRAVRWHVQPLESAEAPGIHVAPMTLAEMRSLLEDELFRLAVDRAFRGDALLLLRDANGPAAIVWKAAAPRRATLLRPWADAPLDVELYVQPHPLRADIDWRRLLPALGSGLLLSKHVLLPPAVATFEANATLSSHEAGG